MAKNTDPATGDLDDGTWHQPAQSEPTLPAEDMTQRKAPDPGSVDGTPAPPRDTVAGPDPTPPPFATLDGKDSPDSDAATPKLGTGGSDEKNTDPATGDLDDGTWHQPAQSEPTLPAEDMTQRKAPDPGSVDGTPAPPHDTVAGPDPTPPPFVTSGGKESTDSDGATPKPGTKGSDEWNLLPAPTIEKGHVVFGKYMLEEKIGKGGMGEVWRVENLPLQKEAALKLIDPKYAQDAKGWRRFEREARVMAKITHPNAVAVYDFRRMHSMAYIEMEFVPG